MSRYGFDQADGIAITAVIQPLEKVRQPLRVRNIQRQADKAVLTVSFWFAVNGIVNMFR
ncbi:MAG: hypothetical protein IPM53_03580 [Anaerolineaceae bacterium]|nr:hypothetical protein [Anaerolineaceae bacterium]